MDTDVILAVRNVNTPALINGVYMKKVFFICFLLSVLSCQSNTCDKVTSYLSDRVAESFECNKPEVFYSYFSKLCPTKDPGSMVGRLACRLAINYIADNINQFSIEGECKKDFISESVKDSLIDTCSLIIP